MCSYVCFYLSHACQGHCGWNIPVSLQATLRINLFVPVFVPEASIVPVSHLHCGRVVTNRRIIYLSINQSQEFVNEGR